MPTPLTWLVTGTSRGIGLNIVKRLIRSPHNVVFATCRDPPGAVALNALENAPETLGQLHVVQMDVTDEASIPRAMDKVKSILGDAGLDYLINNAGVAVKNDTPSTVEPKDLVATVMTNVAGPMLVSRTFTPLIDRGNRKIIINISTSLASIGMDLGLRHTSYSISKAALNMLTYKQAKERPDLIPFLVDPGWTRTEMGGDQATLEPHESAAGIINVASNANPSYAGTFVDYKGDKLSW